MKVILVLNEMPNNCSECPCCNEDECGNQYKGYIGDYLEWNSGRPSWCPLKPMPEKREYIDDNKDYPLNDDYCFSEEEFEDIVENNQISGYNKCIEDLLGE